jgi:TonB family protein
MSRLLRTLLLTIVGAATAAATIAPAEPRKPTARWVVNYDDAQCVATRSYGTAEKPLILAFKPSARGSVMRILMIRKGSAVEAEQRPATVQFDAGSPIAVNALTHSDRQSKQYIATINVPMAKFTANRRATTVRIRGGAFDELLAVPGLIGVAAAFDDCLANLRQVWNVEADSNSRLKQPARPLQPLGNLFRSTTYPLRALQEGDTGSVGVTMLIDEVGKVRDCMVEETSGFAMLDTTSCYVIGEHAKFAPAIAADGKPAKSAVFQRISWRLRI